MNTAFVIIFLFLQIADVWTTHKGLSMGMREANPLLNWLFQRLDPVGVMVIMKVLATWLLWYADMYPITIGACALYVWVVLNNWQGIKGK